MRRQGFEVEGLRVSWFRVYIGFRFEGFEVDGFCKGSRVLRFRFGVEGVR